MITKKDKFFTGFIPLEIKKDRADLRLPKGTLSLTGFTLIEIIIAAIIVSILAILTIPVFKGTYSAFRFENSANKIISLMRYAQEIAVTEQAPYVLRIPKGENKFRLILDQDADKFREIILPKDYTVETNIIILVFNPIGGIEILNREMDPLKGTLSQGTFKIRNKKGEEREIELWSYSGNITFKR